MSDLSVRDDARVYVAARSHTLIISNADAVIIRCLKCGRIKDVVLHDEPTTGDMIPGGRLKMGIHGLGAYRECKCQSLDEAKRLIDKLECRREEKRAIGV